MNIFRTKSLDLMLEQSNESKGLKRTLGPVNLILLGIGAIIGAGLFVRTAAAAGEAAGPAVVISFIVAAIGCAFAGLCYAEFAAMVPISGSAYAYSYITIGEFVAWIIGWALILEYALGAATVSIAWSEYLNKFLQQFFNISIPYEWCHSPFETAVINGIEHTGSFNIISFIILLIITLVLIKGVAESAFVNGVIVIVKVSIVIIFILLGWAFIKSENYTPFLIPENTKNFIDQSGKALTHYEWWNRHGLGGIIGGAGIVFFAFIGFDAVSTAAQEAKNPKRDMPIGILGSLVVCTILYVLFAHVMTGISHWQDFVDPNKGREASVAYAINNGMPDSYRWLAKAVTVAILAGFSSVILVMLLGQSRVFYSMSKDGLIPAVFNELHPKFKTPYKSNIILFLFVSLIAGLVPASNTGDLTSFGTLFAFVLVCIGVLILRYKKPHLERPFKTPFIPIIPILGAIICTCIIIGLDKYTLLMSLIWMLLGLIIYFTYSKKKSKLSL